MSDNWTTEELVKEWNEARHLSPRKIAFLELAYQRGLESVSERSFLETTDGKLGFPKDCYWLQVIAVLLDYLKEPSPVSFCHAGEVVFYREFDLATQLVNYGHLTEEQFENWDEFERLAISSALGIG